MKLGKNVIGKYKLPLIIIAAGVGAMLLGSALEKKETKTEGAVSKKYQDQGTTSEIVRNEFESYADYEERRIEAMLSEIEGAGEIKAAVYVSATPSGDNSGLVFPEIKGVLIYSSGASKNSVKEKIVRAVSSLYGISLSAVNVVF